MKSFESIAKSLNTDHFDDLYVDRQTALHSKRNKVFFHSGDYGDIIYALPVIRAFGGGKLVIGPSTQWKTRLSMTQAHVDALSPLLKLQTYVHGVEFSEVIPDNVDLNLNRFREYLCVEHEHMHNGAQRLNLAEAHLHVFKLPLDECEKAWLTVDSPVQLPDRPVLLHRSARWRNNKFPWQKVMERHAHQAVFVGLESEYNDFTADWGYLPYQPTKDFLELARLIAGSRLYVGNQSLPYAICEGLKLNSVLEVWPEGPNCLFKRKNAIYGESSVVYIPKLKDKNVNTTLDKCPMCGAGAAEADAYRTGTDIVKCPLCSLVYLRTRPDKEQTLMYYQHYADDNSHMRLPKTFGEIHSSGLRREWFMQELLQHRLASGNLLDIGCGWGAFLANAREKGFSPYGVDVCHKAANFSTAVLGIPTLCDELEDCMFKDEMFDVVVSIHTLEHLSETSSVLTRINKLLKPNGLFAGIVPNIGSFCSSLRKEQWQWLDVNTHYVHFDPYTLAEALDEHGFDVVHLYTHTGDYDQTELHRLLEEQNGRPSSMDELAAQIEQLGESGEGEEIVFFAVKRPTPDA